MREQVEVRYKVLDSWRGLAALLVAVFHFPVSGHVHNALLVRHAYLFVDFFFVLSGFVIAHALRYGLADMAALREFMWRRLGRVYPLYAVILAAFLSVELAKLAATFVLHIAPRTAPFTTGSYADPSALASHLLLLQAFGLHQGLSWNWPDWSIAAEVWTYAVFGLVCLVGFAHRRALLCALFAAALVILLEYSSRGIEVTYDLGFIRCLYGFSAGALVYEIYSRCPIRLSGVLATVCECVAVMLALGFVLMTGRNATSMAAPFFFGLVVLIFAFEGGAISRLLSESVFQRLGQLSYAIYIVHALIVLLCTSMASLLLGRVMPGGWRIETYEGIQERVLDVSSRTLPDILTAGYVGMVLVAAVVCWRFVEVPARSAVNLWAGRSARHSGAVAPV